MKIFRFVPSLNWCLIKGESMKIVCPFPVLNTYITNRFVLYLKSIMGSRRRRTPREIKGNCLLCWRIRGSYLVTNLWCQMRRSRRENRRQVDPRGRLGSREATDVSLWFTIHLLADMRATYCVSTQKTIILYRQQDNRVLPPLIKNVSIPIRRG